MSAPPNLEQLAMDCGGRRHLAPAGPRISLDAPGLFDLYRAIAAHVEASIALDRASKADPVPAHPRRFTPGPWFWDGGALVAIVDGKREYVLWADNAISGGLAAADRLGACGIAAEANAEGNEALLAAAPDLLEALRDMVSDHAALSPATVAFARAALAKVDGGPR